MSDNRDFDIIVAGGGLAGITAAVAAAREGAKVLLLERHGFLGGMATAGLVNPFMPYVIWNTDWKCDWSEVINKGVFSEILDELNTLGGLHENRQTFNEELLKLVLDRIVIKYGVSLLLHSWVSAVATENDRVCSVTVTNKSGVKEYKAKYFVDATGDADLIALAGCRYMLGREQDGLCQPMTLCFRLANIDKEKFDMDRDIDKVNIKYKEFREKGLIKNTREDVLIFKHMVENILHFNSTRIVKYVSVNAEELTKAELEGREQVYELFIFMKENIPGFENSQLLMCAPQIGVRESRRIVGEYTITREDLLSTKKFDDSIARGTYPLDIHSPTGSGSTLEPIPWGDYYTIPLRALIPKGMKNLVAAGRPISSTHEAHSAYRIMPICCSIGEGAGAAAVLALKNNLSISEVNSTELHENLDKYKALY